MAAWSILGAIGELPLIKLTLLTTIVVHHTSVEHYGELAPECAELYYAYGDALLLQACEDQTLLGGGGGDADDKDDGV